MAARLAGYPCFKATTNETHMKNDNVNGKPNKLRRILPLVALVLGLGVPVYVYADDCQDCLDTQAELHQQWLDSCNGDSGCIAQADSSYNYWVAQCYAYVCN